MKLKKPKFWDYQKPNLLSYFLLPLTLPIIINNFFLNLKENYLRVWERLVVTKYMIRN